MRRCVSAVAVVGLVALAGCSSGAPDAAPAPSSIPAAGDRAHVEALPATVAPAPTWTGADAAATRALALNLLRVMARDVPADAWLTDVAPFLTAGGQAAAYGTDPATIPFRDVRDAQVGSPSPYLAEAVVDTDAGFYSVLMVRAGAGAPWLVDRWEPIA